ncbi:replication factor C subunit 2/4 [Pancytospora epiphaga]|nr:replication factor C subunit 2/4 [Pancytospora epiphaga]
MRHPMSTLWTEKYRPKTVDDLDIPEHLHRFLKYALEHGYPHLLLYGPPGTGKSTCAGLFKPTLQLNASDERGIETIRGTIKKLADTVTRQVIVLDECENLTKDAQTCLRRVLEDYPNTSFIFCTNYYSKIIDPLKSRLLKLKFKPSLESKILSKIGVDEELKYTKDFYKKLLRKCNGDMRRCINVLQGMKPLGCGEDEEMVDRFVGVIPEHYISLFRSITTCNYEEFIDKFILEGFGVLQLIYQLGETVRGTDKQKALFCAVLSYSEGCSISGCSDELVLNNLCMESIKVYSQG